MASPDGDIDPPRQPTSRTGGVPPLAEPEAPPPGESRQPFEDLLNWAAELDAALSLDQPLDVTRAPTGVAPLNELDEFAQSPVEEESKVDIAGLPTFTPLEEAEPALVWPDRTTDVPVAASEPAPAPVAAESSELERLVKELEDDWFVPGAEPVEKVEPVGGNGQVYGAPVADTNLETSATPNGGAYADAGTVGMTAAALPQADSQEGFWPQEPATRRGGFSGRTAGIAALVAGVAVVGIVLLVIVLRGGGGSSPSAAPSAASLDLPSFPIGSTAQVDTQWELSGKNGTHFAETLTFSNRSSTPQQVQFQEVIPKSIASSVEDVTFVGPAPTVVRADPVVAYVIDIPGSGEVTRTFEITVAPDGAKRSRLDQWEQDLENTSTKRQGTLTTATTTTTAATVPPETEPPPAPPTTRRNPATTRRGPTPASEEPTPPSSEEPPPTPPSSEEPPPPPPPPPPPSSTVPPSTTPPSTVP